MSIHEIDNMGKSTQLHGVEVTIEIERCGRRVVITPAQVQDLCDELERESARADYAEQQLEAEVAREGDLEDREAEIEGREAEIDRRLAELGAF